MTSDRRSGLIKIALILGIILLAMLAATIFLATRKAPHLPVPSRIVQSVIVRPETPPQIIQASKERFGPFHPVTDEGSEVADMKSAAPEKQVWKENAIKPVPVPKGTGKIVIIIDDMGMDKRCGEVIDMKGPLTLSFLPYAPHLSAQTSKAHANGHELMIHVPMEPKATNIDPGPDALRTSMNREQIDTALDKDFNSFTGYVGINNHMGSKLTEDKTRMQWVMEALKKRGLLFVDSMTIADSVGATTAKEYGLAYARRDVFLDDNTALDSVRASLRHLEALAYKNGVAIAIGHPKDNTIAALKEWLPTLKDKGLTLVPVSQVVHPVETKSAATSNPAPFGPPSPQRE